VLSRPFVTEHCHRARDNGKKSKQNVDTERSQK
jgi:hypothetical protein